MELKSPGPDSVIKVAFSILYLTSSLIYFSYLINLPPLLVQHFITGITVHYRVRVG